MKFKHIFDFSAFAYKINPPVAENPRCCTVADYTVKRQANPLVFAYFKISALGVKFARACGVRVKYKAENYIRPLINIFYKNLLLNTPTTTWDNYAKGDVKTEVFENYAKSSPYITGLQQDLYNGYHTFALKWTPEYYVFYIDGEPTWATSDGDVSRVKEFLRLTVEIDAGDGWGPHGQKIGRFDDSTPADDFMVDYVKVYQNKNFEQYIQDDSEFAGTNDLN